MSNERTPRSSSAARSRAAPCARSGLYLPAFDDHLQSVFAPAFTRRHGVAFVLGMLKMRE